MDTILLIIIVLLVLGALPVGRRYGARGGGLLGLIAPILLIALVMRAL